jgi:hypothetical protein
MRWIGLSAAIFSAVSVTACGYAPDYRGIFDGDAMPPVFLGVGATDATRVVLLFDESVRPIGTTSVTPDLGIETVVQTPEGLAVTFSGPQKAGTAYSLYASAEDAGGNTITVVADFYGYNDRVPRLLINEFTVRGTGKHPDCVEIAVLEDGNMAGVAFYEGTKDDWDTGFVFPEMEVSAGDYLVIHCKPQGIPSEVDEIDDPAVSGGYDTHEKGYDFWIPGGDGLTGNNGVLSIYRNPCGDLLDGVLFSNRNSGSDEKYRGFGSTALMKQADQIHREAGWTAAGESIAPEDALSPESSTGTRSICRQSQPVDTDSAADWHVVPTGGATFGTVNSDEIHAP